MIPDDSVPQHSSVAVCKAASTPRTPLTSGTLKNWTSNQNQAVVKLSKRERSKTGRLLFSTNKAIQIALIHRLGELGIRPSEAAEIASAFTMRGSGGGAFIEGD